MSVDEVKAKVQRILTEEFGTVRIDQEGDFSLQNESAVAFVSVRPWGDDEVLIHVNAYMLSDVALTPEVFEWVATEGSYYFGHVHVLRTEGESTGTLVFTHTLLGDFLDKQEMLNVVRSVAIIANDLDDELQSRFGGRKFIEE